MVKIAFLLMCHKNADQVNHLIDRLATQNRDFYVHVDSKSTIYDEIRWTEHVYPAQKRIDVRWGNITQCDAEMTLIETALESGKKYDYYWLISGQDFPIKKNEQIDDYLSDNIEFNFININDITAASHYDKVKRNELYYPKWMFKENFFCKAAKKAWVVVSGGEKNTHHFFKRKNITGLDFRFGANWFCLKYECLKYAYEQLRNRPEIYMFFQNSMNPDECFMQTVISSSPFVESVKTIPLYVDWSEMKPNPKILSNDDLEVLKASDKLIARKFEMITPEIDVLSKSVVDRGNNI